MSVDTGRRDSEFSCHISHFLKAFDFFQELHTVVQEALPNIICHAKGKTNQILFEEGEDPEELFIVLAGEVNAFQTPAESSYLRADDKHIIEGTRHLRRTAVGILKMLRDNSTPGQGSTPPEKVIKARIHNGPPVGAVHFCTVKGASMFGEVGLFEQEQRDCTCLCATDCEFLVIKRQELMSVVKEEMTKYRFRQLAGPLRQLLRDFNFYKDLEPEVQEQVPELLRHVRFAENSVVFKQGDPACCCYIILRGHVSVWRNDLPPPDENLDAGPIEPANVPPRRESVAKVMEKQASLKFKCATILTRLEEAEFRDDFIDPDGEADEAEDGTETENSEKPDIRDELGVQVATIGEGVILGEPGLISDNPRNASAYCMTACEFLMLSKDDFDRVIRKNMTNHACDLPTLVAPLIRRVPFFKTSLRPHLLESVPYMVQYNTMSKGSVLFWEDDPPGNCYLVITGEVTVWKRHTDAPPAPDDMDALMSDMEVLQMCQYIGDKLGPSKSSSRKQSSAFQKVDSRNNILRVSTLPESSLQEMYGTPVLHLGSGMIFGEQALVNDAPRSATITCRTDCKLLTIEKSVFETMLLEDMLKAKVKQLSSTVRRLLMEFQMFSELTLGVLELVPDIVQFLTKPKGSVLFEEGDPPGQCFIVLSGEVTVWSSCLRTLSRNTVIGQPSPSGFQPSMSAIRRRSSAPKRDSNLSHLSVPQGYVMDPQTGEIAKPRPPLVPTSLAACEKCAALASMFRSALTRKMKRDLDVGDLLDDVIEDNSDPIASLGPGNLFGELALLNDNPRSATVTCRSDCEFLVIERHDFDRVIKEEMKRSKDEKLEFLRDYLPGVKKLPIKDQERLLYYFNKVAYPRHHPFLEQGKIMDGAIYCVWQGSVELYCQEEGVSSSQDGKFRRLGILLRGSVFGALPQNKHATYTAIASSTPCEVLVLMPESREHIPNVLMHHIRDHLELTVSRRREQCAPLNPMGGILPGLRPSSTVRGKSAGSRCGSSVPQARSAKMPRPLSGKLPSYYDRPPPEALPMVMSASKFGLRQGSMTMPAFSGIFQKWSTAVDRDEFDMDPGEVLALTARKPKPRSKLRTPGGLSASQSLPMLHGL